MDLKKPEDMLFCGENIIHVGNLSFVDKVLYKYKLFAITLCSIKSVLKNINRNFKYAK
jgi:hypothetical protein